MSAADGFRWKRRVRSTGWSATWSSNHAVSPKHGDWLREGWCRHTIFNLKLPMKKRWQETELLPGSLANRRNGRCKCEPSSYSTIAKRSPCSPLLAD